MKVTCSDGLTAAALERTITHADEPGLEADLSGATFVEPSALVSLACLAEAAHPGPVVITPPSDDGVRNYLSRMRVGDVIGAVCGVDCGLRPVRRRPNSRLLELCRYESEDGADALFEMVEAQVTPLVGAGRAETFIGSLWEIGSNAPQHSGLDAGYFAAQVYQPGTSAAEVKFAVGDPGQGIRRSLAGTPHERPTDAEAIVTASRQRVSRLAKNRGWGLYWTVHEVTRMGGRLLVRSGTARVLWFPVDGKPQFMVRTGPEVPGTLVSIQVPCR